MKKWLRDKDNGKWKDDSGAFLSCGVHIAMKYGADIEKGTIQYDELWNGGYYLVLDEGAGKLPMFGDTLYAEIV